MRIGLDDLDSSIRIIPDKEDWEELWRQVEEMGVPDASRITGYSDRKLYNWKSKRLSIPADFFAEFLDPEGIVSVKSGGKSKQLELELPIEIDEELLTRYESSVSVNRDGVPVYYSSELSLVERFSELLNQHFRITGKLYSREGFELRFPKVVDLMLRDREFESCVPALVDEEGVIRQERIELEDRSIPVEDFEADIYSREKRLQLALSRGDPERLRELIESEVERSSTISP